MSKSNAHYDESTKSRLDELYFTRPSGSIKNRNPVITSDGKNTSLTDIQRTVIDETKCLQTCSKSDALEIDKVSPKDGAAFLKKIIKSVPRSNTPVQIEYYRVKRFENVKKEAQNFIVKFDSNTCIKPRQGVCINTGYVVKYNKFSKLNEDSEITAQAELILLPIIKVLVNEQRMDIIECITARDMKETGFLTIQFTTTQNWPVEDKGQLCIQFSLLGLSVSNPRPAVDFKSQGTVQDLNANEQEIQKKGIFKPRDIRSEKNVYNAKVRFNSNACNIMNGKFMLFKTCTTIHSPVSDNPKLMLMVKTMALLVSRKREWFDPKLITTAGFNYKNGHNKLPKAVFCDGMSQKNSHCLVFIKEIVNLIDRTIDLFAPECGKNADENKYIFVNSFKLLDGSALNRPNSKKVIKCLDKIVENSNALASKHWWCKDIATRNNVPFEKILTIYDIQKIMDPDIMNKIDLTPQQLYENRSIKSRPFSAQIYANMKILAENLKTNNWMGFFLDSNNSNTSSNNNNNTTVTIADADETCAIKRNIDVTDPEDASVMKKIKIEETAM